MGGSLAACSGPPNTMADFAAWYPQLKAAHIGLVMASGLLFALRGALVLAGQGWAMARPWRMLSYGIDTALLAAGVTLWAGLSLNPVSSHWLGAKLLLLFGRCSRWGSCWRAPSGDGHSMVASM